MQARLTPFHRVLVSDAACQGRYREVLLRRVREGDRVLDLGTGTGIHAIFACQAGAGRVYAVEDGEVIEVAKEIARANGFADRIVFLKGLSTQVELPEKVDVIVTHLGFEGALRFLIDARERFLKAGGVVIPSLLELFCAPAELPAAYDEVVDFWERKHYGVDLSVLRKVAVNEAHEIDVAPSQLLAEPGRLARLDVRRGADAWMAGDAGFHASRRGLLHGVVAWYTLWLDDDTPLSTAPPLALPSPLWGHSFFPIQRPVEVEPGDRIAVRMKAHAFTTAGTVWTWEVQAEGRGTSVGFRHSSFEGLPLSRESLRRSGPDYAPPLSALGRAARLTLTLCDGTTPLREIEQKVFAEFGALFGTPEEAAAFVAEVLRKYAT